MVKSQLEYMRSKKINTNTDTIMFGVVSERMICVPSVIFSWLFIIIWFKIEKISI